MNYRLLNSFRRLFINTRSASTSNFPVGNNGLGPTNAVFTCTILANTKTPISKDSNFTFSPRSIDFGFSIPQPQISKISIIDAPISINNYIEEPLGIIYNKEDTTPEKSMDLPTQGDVIEKLAVRMITIRRRKMKVHKRKKFLKRNKVLHTKLNQRRMVKKEKKFKAEIMRMIDSAERFNAKAYVLKRIKKLTQEIKPNRWKGEIIPRSMIRQFMKERDDKYQAKKNRKRLTLD